MTRLTEKEHIVEQDGLLLEVKGVVVVVVEVINLNQSL